MDLCLWCRSSGSLRWGIAKQTEAWQFSPSRYTGPAMADNITLWQYLKLSTICREYSTVVRYNLTLFRARTNP